MVNNYWVRKAHRYMGLFVGIQLLFWIVSGLYFTWNDLDKVRGSHLANTTKENIGIEQGQLADLTAVLATFRDQSPSLERIESVQLRLLLGNPIYEITYTNGVDLKYQLVNARTGELMPLLGEASAIMIARADFTEDVAVSSVELLESASAHAEYRGRDLPVYRVSMNHPSAANIYVSAQRGLVTARRNTTWRIFDFLWMTHTMDYETRDDFNNMLVKVFSVLGLITVLSGFLLWAMTSRVFSKQSQQ